MPRSMTQASYGERPGRYFDVPVQILTVERKKDRRLCKRTFTLYALLASIQSGTENAYCEEEELDGEDLPSE